MDFADCGIPQGGKIRESKMTETNNPYREINATAAYRRLMMAYYFLVKNARWFGKKVAWITSGGPVEPLYAMGVLPFYPENYGAMCGAGRMSVAYNYFGWDRSILETLYHTILQEPSL